MISPTSAKSKSVSYLNNFDFNHTYDDFIHFRPPVNIFLKFQYANPNFQLNPFNYERVFNLFVIKKED